METRRTSSAVGILFPSERKNLMGRREETPTECERPETPSSDASTSGVCSMASSDFESFEEKQETEDEEEEEEEKEEEKEEEPESYPVIIYQKRNILDIFDNIYPYSIYQTTYVPKMNMSNYWERRSVYHRLGPFGKFDEFDFQRCTNCDFYTIIPKRQ